MAEQTPTNEKQWPPLEWPVLREVLEERGWQATGRPTICRHCGKHIRWFRTHKGGNMPMLSIRLPRVGKPHRTQNNYQPHDDCPAWRHKPKPQTQAADRPQEVCGGAS